MSHYSNRFLKAHGRLNKQFVHVIHHCWNCGVEIAQHERLRSRKLCEDCKEKLSTEEIKKLYNKHYQHVREQLRAKKTRPDNDRFIFNSPFRAKS